MNPLPITARDLYEFLRKGRPGDRLLYHRGVLANDRERPHLGGCRCDRCQPVALLADVAEQLRQAALAGRVHLLQRRVDGESGEAAEAYDYIAVRR